MPRRRANDEPVNHERWLVSYADFITLLFAFFVVMYSISQVNQGKYKVLSETLSEAFQEIQLIEQGFNQGDLSEPERRLDPFQVGEIVKSNPTNLIELEEADVESQIIDTDAADANSSNIEPQNEGETIEQGGLPTQFEQLSNQLEENLGDLLVEDMITLRGNEEWLEVELQSSLLFDSGSAILNNSALELLGGIAEILDEHTNPVRVEGFTDNIPINTPQFPSNWELSTARAAAVVQLFTEEGLAPSRFAAIGYGEHQPIADNDTAEGRSANRRVVIMISKTGELRPALREVASAEALIEQQLLDSRQQTGIEIIIPGVDDVVQESAVEQPAEPADGLQGVRTIELDDGGLLFTSELPAEDDDDQ